jgi:hypothetical protein
MASAQEDVTASASRHIERRGRPPCEFFRPARKVVLARVRKTGAPLVDVTAPVNNGYQKGNPGRDLEQNNRNSATQRHVHARCSILRT